MPRAKKHVDELPEFDRFFNRQRFIDETTYGIYELLRKAEKDKAWLSRRLGHAGRSAMTKALRGDNNFKLETLADISLALGRAVHVVWGADFREIRFPIDEAQQTADAALLPFELSHEGTAHVEETTVKPDFGIVRFLSSTGDVSEYPTRTGAGEGEHEPAPRSDITANRYRQIHREA